MYCSKCGVQNSDTSTRCINCGEILKTPSGGGGSALVSTQTTTAQTSRLAVAAFVMGLLCLTCLLWPLLLLPAILCGIIALVKISASKGQLKGSGLAVVGLVIPTVMAMVLPLFLAIMLPAVSKAKDTAQGIVCATNLRALSVAMIVYTNDHDDRFLMPEQWCDILIQKADVSPDSFQCPEAADTDFGYAINKNLYTSNPRQRDAQLVVLFEANLGRNGVGGPEDVVYRHCRSGQKACNIAFADGHTELVTEDRITGLKWTAE